jgi:hypothetical protein
MYVGIIEENLDLVPLLAENPERIDRTRGTAGMQ